MSLKDGAENLFNLLFHCYMNDSDTDVDLFKVPYLVIIVFESL